MLCDHWLISNLNSVTATVGIQIWVFVYLGVHFKFEYPLKSITAYGIFVNFYLQATGWSVFIFEITELQRVNQSFSVIFNKKEKKRKVQVLLFFSYICIYKVEQLTKRKLHLQMLGSRRFLSTELRWSKLLQLNKELETL